MSNVDEHGRARPPIAANETETLLGFLEYQRATLAWKCAGLDVAGLGTTVGTSTMTLGGLLKHLARVEDWWCSWWLWGENMPPPWDNVDWDTEPDWDWHSAATDTPEQIYALWETAVARSRAQVADAMAEGGLAHLAKRADRWDGRSWSIVLAESSDTPPSLRWILFHLPEEYARHIGHADLLRETVDGLTGE